MVNFTVSKAQLVYEVAQVDSDYVNQVKYVLAAGNAYQLNLSDFHCLVTSAVSGMNYQIGCNFTSVRGVLCTTSTNAPDIGVAFVFADSTQTNFRV